MRRVENERHFNGRLGENVTRRAEENVGHAGRCESKRSDGTRPETLVKTLGQLWPREEERADVRNQLHSYIIELSRRLLN